MDRRLRWGVWGLGRAGGSLALALARRNHPPVVTGGRESSPGRTLARREGWPYVHSAAECAAAADVLVLAVNDDLLAETARELGEAGARPGVVVHLSGALPASILAPCKGPDGPALLSFHPLMSLPGPEVGAERLLEGISFGLEGDADGLEVGRAWVRLLGGRGVEIPPGGKVLYHAAAVHASNHLLGLLSEARDWMARACGVSPETAWRLLSPLVAATVRGAGTKDPASVLTGPAVRGDVEVLDRHMNALPPEARERYRLLALAVLEAVGRGEGRLAQHLRAWHTHSS